MPLQFDLPQIVDTKVTEYKDHLFTDDKIRVAWAYCGLKKNPKSYTQPSALVGFRELKGNSLEEEVSLRKVPLTALGQIRLGTIWQNFQSTRKFAFTEKQFVVNFEEGSYRLVSFYDSISTGKALPYPMALYPLQYPKDMNWMIEFDLESGGKLVISCLEFFSRYFGRSEELKRVLSAYRWDGEGDTAISRLYARLDEQDEEGFWKVKLKRRMVNSDVVFLAHAKYDEYTTMVARSINSQIEAAYVPESKRPIFIQVRPWFEGLAEIAVAGIEFDGGRSFLALNLNGGTDPSGEPVIRKRENPSNALQPAAPGSDQAWAGTPQRKLIRAHQIVDITGDKDPDGQPIPVEILDDAWIVLGRARTVIDRKKDKAETSAGPKIKGGEADKYSSGEPHGEGDGTGYASIHAPQELESQGMLRDMWNAMLSLKEELPSVITSVEWFTWNTGFSSASPLLTIPLEAHPQKVKGEAENSAATVQSEELSTKVLNWPYIDTATKEPRSVLVAKMTVEGKPVCFVEIQRRARTKLGSNNMRQDSEESFKGLVCIPTSQGEFKEWLKYVVSRVRFVCGIVNRLEGRIAKSCRSFSHTQSKEGRPLGEGALINALNKVGIDLAKIREEVGKRKQLAAKQPETTT